MKRLVSFLVTLAIITGSTNSRADEQTSVIYPIKINELAPFEGLLLSPSAVATIISDKKIDDQKCKATVTQCEDKTKIELDRCQGEANLSLEKQSALFKKEKSDLDSTISALHADIKNKNELLSQTGNTTYYFVGGLALGVSATLLTSYVISNISR